MQASSQPQTHTRYETGYTVAAAVKHAKTLEWSFNIARKDVYIVHTYTEHDVEFRE